MKRILNHRITHWFCACFALSLFMTPFMAGSFDLFALMGCYTISHIFWALMLAPMLGKS
jgi:hypothetical protein